MIATCGSLFFSKVKAMVIFGAANLAILLICNGVQAVRVHLSVVCIRSGCKCDHPRLLLEKQRRPAIPLRLARPGPSGGKQVAARSLSLGLRADRGRQKTAVVRAHFFGHELVQQGVHAQDEVAILFRIEGEIVRLERVVLQVKELDVVVVAEFARALPAY